MNKLRLAVLIALVASTSAFGAGHTRKGWYIGLGVGFAGDSSIGGDGGSLSFDDLTSIGDGDQSPNVSFNFKAGATLTPRSLIGFDLTASRQQATDGFFGDGGVQINNYFAVYTFFPQREGFFIRAGGGFSSLVFDGYLDDLENQNGYGGLVGVGYGFWIGKRFNITINLDHSEQRYNDSSSGIDRSKFTAFYVGFDWY